MVTDDDTLLNVPRLLRVLDSHDDNEAHVGKSLNLGLPLMVYMGYPYLGKLLRREMGRLRQRDFAASSRSPFSRRTQGTSKQAICGDYYEIVKALG